MCDCDLPWCLSAEPSAPLASPFRWDGTALFAAILTVFFSVVVEGLVGVYCVRRRLLVCVSCSRGTASSPPKVLEGTSGTSFAGRCRAVRRTSDVKRLAGEDANVELVIEGDEDVVGE